MRGRAVLLGWLLLCAPPFAPRLEAAVYTVAPDGSGDLPTISAALLAAVDGDVIELTDGVFSGPGNRNLACTGKAVTIRSRSADPTRCTLDCQGGGRAFSFTDGEGAGTLLCGLTIFNASSSLGGAILCASNSCPVIRGCVFASARASVGGAIYCNGAHPLIDGCVFRDNYASYGGAVACRNGAVPTLSACTFAGNSAAHGAAVSSEFAAAPRLTGCTLAGEAAPEGAGIYCRENGSVFCENTIIAFATQGSAVYCASGGSLSLSCTDIYGNAGGDWTYDIADQLGTAGNIWEDPLFCDAAGGNLTLQPGSPCVHFSAANSECDLLGAWGVGCGYALVTAAGTGDFPTVQAAIDALSDGDVICLAAGTYTGEGNREIDFRGKSLRVMPLDVQGLPPTIDCEHTRSGFRFHSGEGPGTVLSGCRIRNGWAAAGGAISCAGSAPSISRCILEDNTAEFGGAIACSAGASPQIVRTTFIHNSASVAGGALAGTQSSCPRIANCTLRENSAPLGAGIALSGPGSATIEGSLIAFGAGGEAIACAEEADVLLSCCDVFGNAGGDWIGCLEGQLEGQGNMAADPLFCGEGSSFVEERSPCLPTHPQNVACGQIGAWPQGCMLPLSFLIAPDGGGDFATIQSGLNLARSGDTLLLAAGVFRGSGNRALSMRGKAITIRSQDGDPATCVIDCEGAASGIVFTHGEGAGSIVRGITIRNGNAAAG